MSKRPLTLPQSESDENDSNNNKKSKQTLEISKQAESVLQDENLLYEILRHVDDGRTLATASCVSRQWKSTSSDERIWELICTRHYHRSPVQLRPVVLALGGFRQLYSSHLWPILKPQPVAVASSSGAASSAWPCLPSVTNVGRGSRTRWGKDEVNLSLSLLSIKFFEKMSCAKPQQPPPGSEEGS